MGITDKALAVLKKWTTKEHEPGKMQLPTPKERKTQQHTHAYNHQDWYQHARDLPLFTFQTVREMLRDPQVRLCLAMRSAPIFGVEFAYVDGIGQDGKPNWVPGVKARNPIVAAWVQRQLQTIWNSFLQHLLESQTWGWAGGEVTLRLSETNLIEIDALHPRHPKDIRLLELKSCGDIWGIQVSNVVGEGIVELPFPYAYFVRFRPQNGEKYSSSVLVGAYSPWADKWLNGAALDTRRLYMHKDAYGGMRVGYPSDQQVYVNGPDRDPVPARDVALQIAEQRYSGGTVVYPTDHDMNGNEKWKIEDATVASNPQHILQYPKDLDNEIRQGLEIPDGAISNDGSGAWEGKSIPLAAFFSGIDTWVTQILADIRMTLDPLVLLNWGKDEEYEITHKPLGLQAMEQQGAKRDGNGSLGQVDPMQQMQMDQQSDPYRMALDPVDAVGRGALQAKDIVKAARTALGYDTEITTMAAMRAPKGYTKENPLVINGQEYHGGMFIPGSEIEHASQEQLEEIKSGVKKESIAAVEKQTSSTQSQAVTQDEAVKTGPGTLHEKQSKLIASMRQLKLKNGHSVKVQYDRSSNAKTGYVVSHSDPDKNKTEYQERFDTLEEAASFAASMLQTKQLEAKAKSQKQEAEPAKVEQAKTTNTLRENDTPVDPKSRDVFTVPVGSIKTDAKRFQYKVKDIDADGVTQELKSVGKWNPELAGALLVWRDPETGIDYVVNGHHRHDLAKRLGADTINVRYIDAKNALQARARGALANIAEGRGSSIDAAKYLRDTGNDVEHLKDAGISLSGKVAFEATILKNLADKPFQMVTQGTLEESKAIAVAKHLKDHDLQNALFKKLEDREEDGKEWSTREIETAAKKMGNAGKYVEKGQDLFGMFEDEHSTFDQEVELESYVARFLGQEARDFRAVSSQKRAERVADAGNTLAVDENLKRAIAAETAAENFEREAGLRGPISALIKEQAAELAQAKTKKQKEAIKEKTFAKIKEVQRAIEERTPEVAMGDTPTPAQLNYSIREGHELKQNGSGKWAWFKDGQQKTGAFATQQDAMNDPMMEAIESNATYSRSSAEKASKQADASDFESADQLWNHLSNDELQQMIDRDTQAAKELQNDREFDGMGGRRSGPAMANQGSRETFETARKAQRYLDERKKQLKPHELTEEEYLKEYGDSRLSRANYAAQVEQAIEDGETIPRSVAKEFDTQTAKHQPHMLTAKEYRQATGRDSILSPYGPRAIAEANAEHAAAVSAATAAGKDVAPEVLADYSKPKLESTDSMKSMRISERKTYAIDLAKKGMAQTEIADHLMSRGLVSADAKKLASDATYEASVSAMAPGAIKRTEMESQGQLNNINELEDKRKWAENHITIAADDISRLRKQDVYRVIDNAPNDKRGYLENWIIKQRPDLAQEVNEASTDIDVERSSPKKWTKESLSAVVEEHGGHANNSADNVEAIRRKMYEKHGSASPSTKDIREHMDRMRQSVDVSAGKRPSTKYREAAAEKIHEYARSANAVKEAIGFEATPLGSTPHYETATHYAGSILGLRTSGADHPTPTTGDIDRAVTKGREQIVGNVKRMVERAREAGINVTPDMLRDFPEISAEIAQRPGIAMPSTTKPMEEANEGDQLGLFGEAFKAPSRKSNLKVQDPTRARQGGLFDTKGNADQMDLFGDGVMPDDLVYKPKKTSSTGNEALDWIRERTKPMKSFGENLRDEPTDIPNSGIFEGQLPKHMRSQLHEFAKSRANRTQTGKLNDITYNLVADDGKRYTLTLDHRTGDARLTFDHRDANE